MDVVRTCFRLDNFNSFLFTQLAEYLTDIFFNLAVNYHSPVFWCKHHMKLKTVAIAAAALALAVGMTACGGAASTAASSTASSAAASSEVASSEAEATSAEYTVYNTTGSKVTELYLYDAGSEDKGENLAGEGLADGESIVITRDVEADKQADVVYVLEFTTEDGNTQSFDTLHYEVAPISLKSVDAAAGATAIAFEAPQK
mgnify:CR=1 FL=1